MNRSDLESLLPENQRHGGSLSSPTIRFSSPSSNNPSLASPSSVKMWKKNLLLLIITISIVTCLAVYFYLNVIAIDSNQEDHPDRYKPLSRRKPMLDHESMFSDSGPTMVNLNDLLAHCIVALRVGGSEVVEMSLAKNDKIKQVGSKGKTLEGVDDVITGADLKSHHAILGTIKDSYRRLRVISEEDTTNEFDNLNADTDLLPIDRKEFAKLISSDLSDIERGQPLQSALIAQHDTLIWIDPLDATKEYSENLTEYVTLMACIVHKSVPIAGVVFKPFTNETFWSVLNIRTNEYHHSPDLKALITSSKHGERVKEDNVRVVVSRSHAGEVQDVVGKIYGSRAKITSAGGSGYKSMEVIKGSADVYMHMTHIKKWDVCGPHAILHSISGGNMTDLMGDPIHFGDPKDPVMKNGLVASLSPTIHQKLIKLTRELPVNS